MSKRLIVLCAGALVIVIAAAGCGGSGDDSTETAALTKAEFIEQGDAICSRGRQDLSRKAAAYAKENEIDTSNPTRKQQEEFIEAVVAPSLQGQADDLNELAAPSGDEDRVAAIFTALEAGAEELGEDPASLTKGGGPLDEAKTLAGEYGFEVCGQE